MHDTAEISWIKAFLKNVPEMGLEELGKTFAYDGKYDIAHPDNVQTDCTFKLGSMTVRIMQIHDIDRTSPESFKRCARAGETKEEMKTLFPEPPMPIETQQYMMAQDFQASGEPLPKKETAREKTMQRLRADCQEKFWTQLSPAECNNLNRESMKPSSDLASALSEIKKYWPCGWDNGRFDLDHYRQYVRDQAAAEKIWKLVEEDIFIITDRNMQVLFVNVEHLGQLLFGPEAMALMERTIDLYSFFTPLPRPQDQRHVVDDYVRKIHPELDVSQATVDKLAVAKMCVAHFGTWAARPGDRQGRRMVMTPDSQLCRGKGMDLSKELFPSFSTSVLGTAAKMIRFLVEPLDPVYFREGQEVFEGLPDDKKVPHGVRDENFLSLFALGINPYTQRHKDVNDVANGMAGLVTLGNYVGEYTPSPPYRNG